MKLTFLGTGGILGVPEWACNCKVCTKDTKSDKRNMRTRSAILVQSKNKKVIVDAGPDFRDHMLKEDLKKVDCVLITHSHIDHTAGLVELRAKGTELLEMPKEVYDYLSKNRSIIKYLQTRNPDLKISKFKPKKVGSVFIDSIKVKHAKDAAILQTPTFGYFFKENGKRVAYIPDFSEIIELNKVRELDVLIVDGNNFETKYGHLGIKGGLKLYKKVKPKLLIFTHLTHYKSHHELERYVSKFSNIRIAYDGMALEV